MLKKVFSTHVAVGADVVLETASTLPHDASDRVQTTGTAHLTMVDYTYVTRVHTPVIHYDVHMH